MTTDIIKEHRLGPALFAKVDASGVTITQITTPTRFDDGFAVLRLTTEQLEELVRVTTRAGILQLPGGES